MTIVKKISEKLIIEQSEIALFIKKSPYSYKTFYIKKRNSNKKRKISQPSRALKLVQKLVLSDFLQDLPIHKCATAYQKNIGIKDNAKAHVKNDFLLKMDFSNFFPSIKPEDLIKHYEKYKNSMSDADKNSLKKIFFLGNRKNTNVELSIGAPSSPFISNTLLYDFDQKINAYCSERNITYTRYADDIAFSTNIKNSLYEIPDVVKKILIEIDYPKLKINKEKTVFASKKKNRHLTGLVLTNENTLSIGRTKKREIKTLVFLFSKKSLGKEKSFYLRGYISYISDVDPEFYSSLVKKYGIQTLSEIKA
jgi:RNA-directed DNA polymerase